MKRVLIANFNVYEVPGRPRSLSCEKVTTPVLETAVAFSRRAALGLARLLSRRSKPSVLLIEAVRVE